MQGQFTGTNALAAYNAANGLSATFVPTSSLVKNTLFLSSHQLQRFAGAFYLYEESSEFEQKSGEPLQKEPHIVANSAENRIASISVFPEEVVSP